MKHGSTATLALPDSKRIGFFGQAAFVAALAVSAIAVAIMSPASLTIHALLVCVAAMVLCCVVQVPRRLARAAHGTLLGVLVADFSVLFLLLYVSGGLLSPFGVLLLLPISLAFIFLEAQFATVLVGASVVCFAGVLRLQPPSVENAEHHHIVSHLYGMLVAFALLACLVSSAIRGLRAALQLREGELRGLASNSKEYEPRIGSLSARVFASILSPQAWFPLLCVGAATCAVGFFVFPSFFGHHHSHSSVHLTQNMLLMGPVIAATIGFICYVIMQLTRSLAHREQQLSTFKDRMRQEHLLSSLATLAAGTAHELCSPLTTIAVIAKELELQLATTGAPLRFAEDLRIVRSQVERCREILGRMNCYADSGVTPESKEIILKELMDSLEQSVQRRNPSVRLMWNTNVASVWAPAGLIDQITQNLLDNAVDASSNGQEVHLLVAQIDGVLRISVRDQGQGMSSTIRARAGEPFFTTKDVGTGTGMGLFIVRSLTGRFGQSFQIDSAEGQGTTVSLELCLDLFDEPVRLLANG